MAAAGLLSIANALGNRHDAVSGSEDFQVVVAFAALTPSFEGMDAFVLS